MEASQGPQQPQQDAPAASPASQQAANEQQPPAQEQPTVATGQSVPPAHAEEQIAEQDVDRNPAEEQAPVASEAQNAVIGDPGLRDEQNAQGAEGMAAHVDTPVRSSAPPASLQSGMPLAEDRAAAEAQDVSPEEAAARQRGEQQEATDSALAEERGT